MGKYLLDLYSTIVDTSDEQIRSYIMTPSLQEYLYIEEGNLINDDVLKFLFETVIDLTNEETKEVMKSATDLIKELPLEYSKEIIEFVFSFFKRDKERVLDFLKDLYKTQGIDLDDLDDISFILRNEECVHKEELVYSLKYPSSSYELISYELMNPYQKIEEYDVAKFLKYKSLYRAITQIINGNYDKLNDISTTLEEIEDLINYAKSKNLTTSLHLTDLLKYLFLEEGQTREQIKNLYLKLVTYNLSPSVTEPPEVMILGYLSSLFKDKGNIEEKIFVFDFALTRIKYYSIHDMLHILNLLTKEEGCIEIAKTIDELLPKGIKIKFITYLTILQEGNKFINEDKILEIIKQEENPYVKLRLSLRKK